MNSHFKKFLLSNSIATLIILLVGGVLFSTQISEYFHFSYIIIVLLAFFVNIAAFYIVTKERGGKDKSMQIVIKAFAIKFFSYLIMALVFLLLAKTPELKITFVILLFGLYVVYTVLEITSLMKFFKTEQK